MKKLALISCFCLFSFAFSGFSVPLTAEEKSVASQPENGFRSAEKSGSENKSRSGKISSLANEFLLENYLANDVELKKLFLEVKKAELSLKSDKIDNGIDVNLSTGKATFSFSQDNSYVKLNPSASLSIPQAQNLSLNVSSDLNISLGGEKNGLSGGTNSGKNNSSSFSDTSISLSADIISGSALTRKIALKKAERNLLEAKRNFQNYALTSENNYYKSLLSLFSLASDITFAQKDMYDDEIDFEEIKALGFSANSAKYRQAELKVLSDKHSIETKIHELEHDCAVFASKCGTTYDSSINPHDFLPSEVPIVESLDILSFKKENYTKIESAKYEQEIAILTRKADKNFTLGANAGYTFENSASSSDSENYSDTIDAGLDFGFKGIDIGTGISLPTDGKNPIYTLSATLNPNEIRKSKIKKETNKLDEDEELLEIVSAENDYDDDIVDKQTELADINWSKETDAETYEMYVDLERDLKNYLASGIITESEYLSSFANKELYRIKLIMDDINLIVYNNELKLLFCRDDELE